MYYTYIKLFRHNLQTHIYLHGASTEGGDGGRRAGGAGRGGDEEDDGDKMFSLL